MAATNGVKVPVKTKKVSGEQVRKKVKAVQGKGVSPETEKIFDEFVDHQKKAITEATKAVESLIPPEFRKHGEAALKEMVEGYRGLFNSAVDEIVSAIERVKLEDKDHETSI